jgi:protein SCO1
MKANLIAGLLAAALLPGLSSAHGIGHAAPALAEISGLENLVLPDFPVQDAQGDWGQLSSIIPAETPLILSFTYTGCESLCDITNAVLLAVDQMLTGQNSDATRIVTLTIDPIHDTPERLDASRKELGATERWLWLTAGTRGTAPLLDALRFPPGPVESHDPVFLIGRPCSGQFLRIVGLPAPEQLLAQAQALPECAG